MFNKKKIIAIEKSLEEIAILLSKHNSSISDLTSHEEKLSVEIKEISEKIIKDKDELCSRLSEQIVNLRTSLQEDFDQKICLTDSRINEVSQVASDNINKLIQQISVCNNTINELAKQANAKLDLLSTELKTVKTKFDNALIEIESRLLNAIDKIIQQQTKDKEDIKQIQVRDTQTDNLIRENRNLIRDANQTISVIRQNLEKGLLDTEHKLRIYVDSGIVKLKEEVAVINGKLTFCSNVNSQQDIKIKFLEDTAQELKNENKDSSQKVSSLKNSEDRLTAKINTLSDSVASKIDIAIDKKSAEYQRFINQEYYEAIVKILTFNQKMLSKVDPKINADEIEKLKSQLEQKALEEKWRIEKQKQGQEITNKGILIIDKRKQLHDEILLKEKQGEDVTRQKERLKVYDEILEVVK